MRFALPGGTQVIRRQFDWQQLVSAYHVAIDMQWGHGDIRGMKSPSTEGSSSRV
jgi:hypothetical protein